jgi:Mg-chelatase subunit ChlD
VFDIRLVVRNGHGQPVPGRADIYADERLLTRQAVSLEPGLSVLEIPAQILQRGNYLLRAEVQTDADTITGNNSQSTSLAVAGKTRALVITDNPKTHLARALHLKEVDIEFRRPEGLPTSLPQLLDYNSVVFDDIGRKDVTQRQMTAIERYVRDFGGGFLMAGGARTFGTLDYQNSAIERLLPVSFHEQRPQKKKRIPIALFLLIDRSNSMGYNSRVRGLHDGQKMEYAQKAAVAVLGQLKNTDLAGAIAFDSEAYALSALKRLSQNRSTLRSRIGRLRYGGGTDFYNALEAAADQLSRSRRSIRHIILLTDGDTNRSPTDHYPLIKTIAQRQISITTIRIGSDTVNLQLLSYMSEKTGGRFYHVEDATMLPQLLVRDTRQTLRQQGQEDEGPKDIVPQVGVRGQILRGLSDFPALDEYMLTKPKKRANVQLYTDIHGDQDPLLATWQYGLGKVVVAPFDPSGAGSGDWIRWERFGKFWSQAVRWAMRNETPLDYRLSATKRGERTILRVESFDNTEDSILQARLASGTRNETLTLMPVAPRISEAVLPARYTGNVPVTIVKRRGNTILNQRSQTVLVGQEVDGALREYRQQQPNRPLLHALAEGTGGSLNPTFDELTSHIRGGQKVLLHPLENTLIIIALFFLLADIALRVLFGPPPETSPL